MDVYYKTAEEMEDEADAVKVCVITALVNEGVVTREWGDEWTKSHTVIYRKKNIFRTLSNLWKNEPVLDNLWFLSVVKKV